MRFQAVGVAFRDIDARENAAIVRTVISIMKQGDIPVVADSVEEIEECTRPLGKFKSKQAFVLYAG